MFLVSRLEPIGAVFLGEGSGGLVCELEIRRDQEDYRVTLKCLERFQQIDRVEDIGRVWMDGR